MRQGYSSTQRAASAGEAKGSDSAKSPLFGVTTAPAGMDHQVPRPNFGQTLARCDLEGREPVFATPDSSLEHDYEEDHAIPPSFAQNIGGK